MSPESSTERQSRLAVALAARVRAVVAELIRWAGCQSDHELEAAGSRAKLLIAEIESRSARELHSEAQALLDDLFPRLHGVAVALQAVGDVLAVASDGMLTLDAVFVRRLEENFGSGNDVVSDFRNAALAAWNDYCTAPSTQRLDVLLRRWSPTEDFGGAVVPTLSKLVWAQSTRQKATQAKALESVAAVSPAIGAAEKAPNKLEVRAQTPALYDGVLAVLVSSFWDPRRHVRIGAKAIEVVNRENQVVGWLPLDGLHPRRLAAMIHATEGLPAHELVRWMVAVVTRQGSPDLPAEARRIVVQGGLSGLAMTLGKSSSSVVDKLRDALDIFSRMEVELPHGGKGVLLKYRLSPAKRGAMARLEITVSDALLPGYGSVILGRSPTQREARRLVPLPVGPERLSPFVGYRGSHGAQAALQVLILREMRRQAETLAARSAVQIPMAMWQQLAELVGVKASLLPELIDRWATGEGKKPAFLLRPIAGSDEAFGLGEGYAGEHELIIAGAEAQRRGRRDQKRSRRAKMHSG